MHRRFSAAVVALLSLSLSEAAFAQTADEYTSDALRAGSWSIDFAIEDDFQIGSFEGAAISATHHTSERGAWRYGLSFSGSVADNDRDQTTRIDSVETPSSPQHRDISAFSLGLEALRLVYPDVSGRIRPYVGFGPSVSFERLDNTIKVASSKLEEEQTIWAAAGEFVLGVEVFAARRVSLIGQYGASVGYEHNSGRTTTEFSDPGGVIPPTSETIEQTENVWRVGQGAVRLGVSAYF